MDTTETSTSKRYVTITLVDGSHWCFGDAQVIHENGFVMIYAEDDIMHLNSNIVNLITFDFGEDDE